MKVFIVLFLVAAAVESITAQSLSDCNLPPDTGPCFGYFPRYYYDPTTNNCKKFIYGGCGGNRNNFWTQEECQDKCRVKCGENAQYTSCGTLCPLTCDNYENPPQACAAVCVQGCQCKKGFVRTESGRCVKPEECPVTGNTTLKDCNRLPEIGPCKRYVPRYYYDPLTDTCFLFIYGGCGGNKNNFKTQEECYQKCSRVQCEENAHYEDCGTACPLTCENYENPPDFCPAVCRSGCQCDEGFVQTESGRCVKPEDCPVKCYDCPPNKEYGSFGDCPDSCYSLDHPERPCTLKLNFGCKCKPGYVLKEDKVFDSDCIKPEECPFYE